MVVEVMNVYVALDLLAKAVREAREERGLSQRELTRKLSMNLALEGDGGPSRQCRLHGDIAKLGHANARGAERFHDEGEAFLIALPRGGEKAVVLLLRQLAGAVPKNLPLDAQKFELDRQIGRSRSPPPAWN